MERYKENPNAPRITFIRRNGHIIPIVQGHAPGVRPRVAANMVGDQVHAMEESIKNAEKGSRVHMGYGTDHRVVGVASTYPKFYSQLGFRSKSDFESVLSKPGIRQQRLMDQAVHDLKKGENYGMHLPNRGKQFQVATREIFDNQNVVFRKMNGKVVPLKVKNAHNNFKHRSVSDWSFD